MPSDKKRPTGGSRKSMKRLLGDHLADAHDIWFTTGEFRCETVATLAMLDPCKYILVA